MAAQFSINIVHIFGLTSTDWRYLSLQSYLLTGNAYGVDFAFKEIPESYSPIDRQGLAGSPSTLYAGVTNLITGQAEYHTVKDWDEDWKWLRASSAMPFVSRNVVIDDVPYLDGGLSDPIPLDYSLNLGAKKHIVLLSQDRKYIKGESKMYDGARLVYRDYPEFCNTIKDRTVKYNEVRDRVEKMHQNGEIFAIWPPSTYEVGRMETDRAKLFKLYFSGYTEAQRLWPQIKSYLEL